MLKWPGRAEADAAARAHAARLGAAHPELVRLGDFGSYARGERFFETLRAETVWVLG